MYVAIKINNDTVDIFPLSQAARRPWWKLSPPVQIEIIATGSKEFCETIMGVPARPSRARPSPRQAARPVICVDTMQRFESAAAACEAYGIHPGNMSKHLAHKPGYRRCRGLLFRYV